MTITKESTGSSLLLEVDSFLSLPPRQRSLQRFSDTVRKILSSEDTSLTDSLFTDSRWLDEWLLYRQRYMPRELERKRASFMALMTSSPNGRDALLRGMALLNDEFRESRKRNLLIGFARELSQVERPYWAHWMWTLFGDPQCLYSTLDAEFIREERASGVLSPSGSYQLLDGDESCQRLFFTFGFHYYANRIRDWGRFCRYVERHPWAWEHILTTDMCDPLLLGMLEYIHALPPSLRHPLVEPFLRYNHDEIAFRMQEMSYLLGRPQDYEEYDDVLLSEMSTLTLFKTGAVGYHLPNRRIFRFRLGVVVRKHEGRVRVLCSDSSIPETRQMLYEDMDCGTPVVLWKDGVIRVRRMSTEVQELMDALTLKASSCHEDGTDRFRYPVFEYRDLVLEALNTMHSTVELPFGENMPGLGRERLLEVMWRVAPRDYAQILVEEMKGRHAPE